MNKEKPDSIFNQISGILNSLGRLAEKGQQLKQTVDEAVGQSPSNTNSQQKFIIQTKKIDSGWQVKLSADDLARTKIDLRIENDLLHIKLIEGRDIEYKDVQLESGVRINTVNLDNIAGCIDIYCCR